jgi:FkbM family methyltransferase
MTREYDAQFSKPIRAIVDAGANIGVTSVFYANKYPEATIVAIEPEEANFQILKKNIAPYPNIIAFHAALWKADQEISLIDPKLGNDGFRTVETVPIADGRTSYKSIRGITLRKLILDLNLGHVDLLKMDIEGSEKEVFDYSEPWIREVGVIAIELHDHIQEGCTRSVYEATKHFDFQWREGETLFFARKEYISDSTAQRRPLKTKKGVMSRIQRNSGIEIVERT